jgi:hypothetical protein
VALATDDEGVSRSDMTEEYLRAVEIQGLSYIELKRVARQSLEHSFILGESLWQGAFRKVSACASEPPDSEKVSRVCQKFLHSSEKARLQWNLEEEFKQFEREY